MSPATHIRALRCSDFPLRLSGTAGFLLYVAIFIFGSALGPRQPLIVVVPLRIASAALIWFSERRPAVWIIPADAGGAAVHHRPVFWKRSVGAELMPADPDLEIGYEPGPWWRAAKLWIGPEAFFVMREAGPWAQELAGVRPPPVYRKINGR